MLVYLYVIMPFQAGVPQTKCRYAECHYAECRGATLCATPTCFNRFKTELVRTIFNYFIVEQNCLWRRAVTFVMMTSSLNDISLRVGTERLLRIDLG